MDYALLGLDSGEDFGVQGENCWEERSWWGSDNRIINIILIGKVDRVLSMLIVHLVIVAYVSRWLLLFYQSLSIALRIVHLVFIMILIQMSQRCRILMSALSFVVVVCSSSFIWHHEWLPLTLSQLILPRTKIRLSIWCLFCVEEPILLHHSSILLLGWSRLESASIVVLMRFLIVNRDYAIWYWIISLHHMVVWIFDLSIARSSGSHWPYVAFEVVPYSLRSCLIPWCLHLFAALIGRWLMIIASSIIGCSILLLVLNISGINLTLLLILFSEPLSFIIPILTSRRNGAISLLLPVFSICTSLDRWFQHFFRRSQIWMMLFVLRLISFVMADKMWRCLLSWRISWLLRNLFSVLLLAFVPKINDISFIDWRCSLILLWNHIGYLSHRRRLRGIHLHRWSSTRWEQTSSVE